MIRGGRFCIFGVLGLGAFSASSILDSRMAVALPFVRRHRLVLCQPTVCNGAKTSSLPKAGWRMVIASRRRPLFLPTGEPPPHAARNINTLPPRGRSGIYAAKLYSVSVAGLGSITRASHPGVSACRLDWEGCGYDWSSEPAEGLAPGHLKLERCPPLQTWAATPAVRRW